MTKFIKLTERYSDGREQTLLLNAAHIMSVKKASGGPDTHIVVNGTRPDRHGGKTEVFFFVRESVADIERLLCE